MLINKKELNSYAVSAINKRYEFWQRDPLAIHLFTPNVAYQKLEYIHNNPTTAQWQLANHPVDYLYSSVRFYEFGDNKFEFLKDLRLEF